MIPSLTTLFTNTFRFIADPAGDHFEDPAWVPAMLAIFKPQLQLLARIFISWKKFANRSLFQAGGMHQQITAKEYVICTPSIPTQACIAHTSKNRTSFIWLARNGQTRKICRLASSQPHTFNGFDVHGRQVNMAASPGETGHEIVNGDFPWRLWQLHTQCPYILKHWSNKAFLPFIFILLAQPLEVGASTAGRYGMNNSGRRLTGYYGGEYDTGPPPPGRKVSSSVLFGKHAECCTQAALRL
jgi:hypothetical protein